MNTVVEVIAYAYHGGSHLTGVKMLSGRELQANDLLRTSTTGTRWKVRGLGTINASAHQAGVRPITLSPEDENERLTVGSTLVLEEE